MTDWAPDDGRQALRDLLFGTVAPLSEAERARITLDPAGDTHADLIPDWSGPAHPQPEADHGTTDDLDWPDGHDHAGTGHDPAIADWPHLPWDQPWEAAEDLHPADPHPAEHDGGWLGDGHHG
jgi:hypothetical protein